MIIGRSEAGSVRGKHPVLSLPNADARTGFRTSALRDGGYLISMSHETKRSVAWTRRTQRPTPAVARISLYTSLCALVWTSTAEGFAQVHQENRIYIIEEKNWRIILYYLEFAQINANYMNLHFLLNQKGPRKF